MMSRPRSTYSPEFLDFAAESPMSLRARRALDFMLAHGDVTTAQLFEAGYGHGARAIRDLKDAGFEIESQMVRVDGRRMSKYSLIDSVTRRTGQRRPVPRRVRSTVFDAHGHRCAVCGARFESRQLQLDHRVPFHIGGDPQEPGTGDFMPLCGSDNRAKSKACESCPNWSLRDASTCRTCYWHDPESYHHVATRPERRIVLTIRDQDVDALDASESRARAAGVSTSEYLTELLRRDR